MDVSAKLPTLPEQPSLLGYLVVRTGRHSGTRRGLQRPLTVLGQALGCDIRLPEEGVAPYQCVVTHEPLGPLLRVLDSSFPIRVNGQIVTSHRLANGDVVEMGSEQFVVELETPPTNEAANADTVLLEREREALRVQAAAVAAQQAALLEEEGHLDQRASLLALQETQLARHLEERQQRLDQEQECLRQEREDFETGSNARRAGLDAEASATARDREEVEDHRRHVEGQRRRLNDLRRKLWKRYQRHWESREEGFRRVAANLQTREEGIQRRGAAVQAFFERVNSVREVGRRQLREEAEELALAQQRWQESTELERQEQKRRSAEVEHRLGEIAAAREALLVEQTHWRKQVDRLQREANGLEARVRHQREQLDQLRREAKPTPEAGEAFTPLPMAPALAPEANVAWPAGAHELAGMLGDQRAHLAEQWQRLLELQKAWQEERLAALGEIEATGGKLAVRERELQTAEGRLQGLMAEVEERKAHLDQARASLEAWQARLVVEQSEWQAQRDEALTDLEARERGFEQLRRQFDEERKRFDSRLGEELDGLRESRARCDEARRQYSHLWQDCEELRASLADQQRRLAGEALALERLRQEYVNTATNSVRAERRLEKLTRREVARLEVEERAVEVERGHLLDERALLDEEGKRMGQIEAALLARQREWSRQLDDWEQLRRRGEEADVRRGQELSRLRARHVLQERQLGQLREEIERLARTLIEDVPEPRIAKAA